VRFITDENFNGSILRGLLRRLPELDIVRVQDVGLLNADDPTILSWSANENRILLTHDVETMTAYAYSRIEKGLVMPGVVEVIATAPIGRVIEDLELLALCGDPEEFRDRIIYIPFPQFASL